MTAPTWTSPCNRGLPPVVRVPMLLLRAASATGRIRRLPGRQATFGGACLCLAMVTPSARARAFAAHTRQRAFRRGWTSGEFGCRMRFARGTVKRGAVAAQLGQIHRRRQPGAATEFVIDDHAMARRTSTPSGTARAQQDDHGSGLNFRRLHSAPRHLIRRRQLHRRHLRRRGGDERLAYGCAHARVRGRERCRSNCRRRDCTSMLQPRQPSSLRAQLRHQSAERNVLQSPANRFLLMSRTYCIPSVPSMRPQLCRSSPFPHIRPKARRPCATAYTPMMNTTAAET